MSIETIRRVYCDDCGINGPEVLESESPNALAIGDGWIALDDGSHYCPKCAPHNA